MIFILAAQRFKVGEKLLLILKDFFGSFLQL